MVKIISSSSSYKISLNDRTIIQISCNQDTMQ